MSEISSTDSSVGSTVADPTSAAQIPAAAAHWLLGLAAVLLFLGHPTSLLPRAMNVDGPVFRLGAMALGLAGVVASLLWRRQRWTRRLAWSSLGCLWILLIVFMPAGLSGRRFLFVLPGTILLLPLALYCLAIYRWRMPRWLWIAAAIFLLKTLLATVISARSGYDGLSLIAYLLIPAGIAVAARAADLRSSQVAWVAAAFWLVLMGQAMIDLFVDGWLIRALTGNPNWTSAVLLAVTPWVAWGLYRLLARRLPALAAGVIGTGLVVAPALWLTHRASTRAGIVTVAGIIGWALLCRIVKRPWRYAFVVIGVAAAVWLVWQPPSRLSDATRDDVRLPLWQLSGEIVADHPWRGIGPGRLPEVAPAYAADTGFYARPHITNVISHPHNELLHLALALGLPAMLAFVVLLLPVLGDPLDRERPTFHRLALVSAQVMVGMSMFDKPMAEHPSALMALLALGLVWRYWLDPARESATGELRVLATVPDGAAPGGARLAGLLAALIGAYCVGVGGKAALASWHHMRATQFTDFQRHEQAEWHLDRAVLLAPYEPQYRYERADLQLFQMGDLEAARRDYQALFDANPSYSHVNRRLGQIHLQTGDLAAARDAFMREAAVFPDRPVSWQWVMLADTRANRLDDIPMLDQRIYDAFVAMRTRRTDPAGMPARLRAWRDAVLQGATDQRAPLSWDRIPPMYLVACDANAPWLLGLDPDARVAQLQRGAYWHRLFWRDLKLSDGLPADADIREQANAVAAMIAGHCATAGDPARAFTMPVDTWQAGEGSAAAILALQAWMLQGLGLQCLALPDAGLLVTVLDGQVYTLSPGDDALQPGLPEAATADLSTGVYFADPEEFLAPNHAAAIYYREWLPEIRYLGGLHESPSHRWLRLRDGLRAAGVEPPARPRYWGAPFTLPSTD